MDDRPGALWIHSLYGQKFQEDSPGDQFNQPYAASPIIPTNLCWLSCILCCLLAQTNFVLFIETGLYTDIPWRSTMGLLLYELFINVYKHSIICYSVVVQHLECFGIGSQSSSYYLLPYLQILQYLMK